MTSGYMFTRIRGTPFTSGGSWIAPGYQNQYGQETQVVAAICKSSFNMAEYHQINRFLGRRTISGVILDVDNSYSYPNVSRTAENSGLRLDRGHHDHLLHLDLLVQVEKQRYVFM